MTMKEAFTRALEARGETLVKRTFRYDVWSRKSSGTHKGTGLHYYVGRSGSLRVGPTVQGSVPCNEAFKAILLEEGRRVS